MKGEPAIVTLTGDNGLTVGIMQAVLYLGALLAVQLYKRTQTAKSSPAPSGQAGQ